MRVGQTSAVVFISGIFSSVLGFVATLYFARVLGAEVLGYFAVTIALVSWIKLVGDVGITNAIRKRISEGEDQSEYATAGGILVLCFALLIGGTSLLIDGQIADYVGRPVAGFVSLMVIASLMKSVASCILNGERKVHLASVINTFGTGTRSVVQISFVLAGAELAGMLGGKVVGLALAALASITLSSVTFARPTFYHFRQLIDYAKFAWLGAIESRTFNDVDILILGSFVSPTLVGIYSVCWTISKFMSLFSASIRAALFPEISHSDAHGDRQQVSEYVSSALAYCGLFTIPGFVGAVIVGDKVLRVYGPEFRQGQTVLGLLLLACLFYGYQQQLINSLNAIDRPDLSFRINAGFIGTNAILNLALIQMLGWVGAAIATAVSAAIGLTMTYLVLQRVLPFSVPSGEILRQILAAALMGGTVYIGRLSLWKLPIVSHNFVQILALLSVGVFVYFGSLLAISSELRTTVRTNLPKRLTFLSD